MNSDSARPICPDCHGELGVADPDGEWVPCERCDALGTLAPDECRPPMTGWWAISGEALLAILRRCADGEDPDLVYAEQYANSEVDGSGAPPAWAHGDYVTAAIDAHQLVAHDEIFDDDPDSPTCGEYVTVYRKANQ